MRAAPETSPNRVSLHSWEGGGRFGARTDPHSFACPFVPSPGVRPRSAESGAESTWCGLNLGANDHQLGVGLIWGQMIRVLNKKVSLGVNPVKSVCQCKRLANNTLNKAQ